MVYGTTNGDYHCDSCGRYLPEGSVACVEFEKKKGKLYCIKCKPLKHSKKYPKIDPKQKKLLVLEAAFKIVRKQNRKLRRENSFLKRELNKSMLCL